MAAMIPVFLKTDPVRPCLVVGGGDVARRKVRWLLESDARVEVMSLRFDPALEALARERPGAVTLRHEAYDVPGAERDLSVYQLAVAATDQPEVNAAVAADACRAGIPVNVVDAPENCSFYVPAIVKRGELTLAVGTGGACPSLAARIRRELQDHYPEAYAAYTAALGRLRREAAERWPSPRERRRVLDHLASAEVAGRVLGQGEEAASAELARQAERFLAGEDRPPTE